MHIGFIMDGNRRWATLRNLAKTQGHHVWVRTFEAILEYCKEKQIAYATFWALAKKNIEERSKEELTVLYSLLEWELKSMIPKMMKENIRFEMIGDLTLIPKTTQEIIAWARDKTKGNTSMTVILGIGYGWQEEIVRAVKKNDGNMNFKRINQWEVLPSISW